MFNNRCQICMIRWRLRVLMAEKHINNKTLAKLSGIHPTTISRLKNTDEIKQINGDVLNALCVALNCTPNDLLEFTPEPPPDNFDSSATHIKSVSSSQKSRKELDDLNKPNQAAA